MRFKAAGLNPILSSKYGGSSTPTGSSFQGQQAKVNDVLSPAVQAYWSAKSTEAQVKNVEADTDLKVSQAGEIDEKIITEPQRRAKIEQEIKNLEQTEKNLNRTQKLQVQEQSLNRIKIEIQTTENKAAKEKLAQLYTLMAEHKGKEKFWQIVGPQMLMLSTAAKGATVGATILAILKYAMSFTPAGKFWRTLFVIVDCCIFS